MPPNRTLRRRFATPMDGLVALLSGEPRDLTGVTVDLEHVPEFNRRVYAIARSVPPGATISYGEIAARLGEPGAAREVGEAMGRNPVPIVVPATAWWRPAASSGDSPRLAASRRSGNCLAIESRHARNEDTLFGLARAN